MPLCPQITITPVTVTATGMTQASVIAANDPATTEQLGAVNTNAAAALAAAAAAQADATEALADAAIAYDEAIGSLQPSANTIVNSSNQMTAINAGGITVYSGASASSGARVVMNSAGLAGFDSGGAATFSISASTGAAVFSGSVTGSAITGGTLNIAGNCIINSSGNLTATGVTLTGNITATSGSFTGTITATSGNVGGFTIGANTLSAASGVTLNASTGGVTGVNVTASAGGSISGGGFSATSSALTMSGTIASTGQITCGGNFIQNGSTATFQASAVQMPNLPSTTSAANMRWGTGGVGALFQGASSSARFKENIVDISLVDELDPRKLLQLPVRAFTYREDYLQQTDERAGCMVPGFIAEEVSEIYTIAADFEKGEPNNWNDKYIIPGLLALIQDQEKRIKQLEGA